MQLCADRAGWCILRMFASTCAALRLLDTGKADAVAVRLSAGASSKTSSALCEPERLCCNCSCAAAGAHTAVLTAGLVRWRMLVGLPQSVLGLAPAPAAADREAKLTVDASPCFSTGSERAAQSVMASICSWWACCCMECNCPCKYPPASCPAGLAPADAPAAMSGAMLQKDAPEPTMASIRSVVASNMSDGSCAASTACLSLASLRALAAC